MFAIVETGGKQYRVEPNQKIIVEKIAGDVGSKVNLDKILFLKKESGEVSFGSPFISGAEVEAEIIKTFKDDKIIVFKKRRRQNSRRKNGHRQKQTILKVLSIKS